MLPTLGSKANHSREKNAITWCTRSISRSISGFATAVDTPRTSSISGFCAAGTASTGGISSAGSVRTASTRSIPQYSQYAQYTSEYEVYSDHLRIVSTKSYPLKHSQTVPPVGVGAHYFRWGQFECLEYRQYFGNRYCEYSQ